MITTTDPAANQLPQLLRALSILATEAEQTIEVVIVDDLKLWPDADSCTYEHYDNLLINTLWYPEIRGQLTAILCGIEVALHDQLLTIDPDMHTCVQDISAMQTTIARGYSVVHGARPQREDIGAIRRLGSHLANTIVKRLTHIHVNDIGSPVALIDRYTLQNLAPLLPQGPNPKLALYMALGNQVASQPLSAGSAKEVPSQYSLGMLVSVFVRLIRDCIILRARQHKSPAEYEQT
ncbi:MAG: hypothetical protein P1U79_10250 [Alcanivorax jadensis]|nr:hypothetical protein [Alcanivorax jadensis]